MLILVHLKTQESNSNQLWQIYAKTLSTIIFRKLGTSVSIFCVNSNDSIQTCCPLRTLFPSVYRRLSDCLYMCLLIIIIVLTYNNTTHSNTLPFSCFYLICAHESLFRKNKNVVKNKSMLFSFMRYVFVFLCRILVCLLFDVLIFFMMKYMC